MSAMNALAKSGHQTATPDLRAGIKPEPSPIWISLGCGFCGPVITCGNVLENLKHFRSKLKCLALYQILTKNFTGKTEMLKSEILFPEPVKTRFVVRHLKNLKKAENGLKT